MCLGLACETEDSAKNYECSPACTTGQVCINKKCTAKPECDELHRPCANGVCVRGKCIECDDENACAEGLCENGKCEIQCTHNGECDATTGEICLKGLCTWMECEEDNECTQAEQLCLKAEPTAPGACQNACREDDDCLAKRICSGAQPAATPAVLGTCQEGCRVKAANTCGGNGYSCQSNGLGDPSEGVCMQGCYTPADCPETPEDVCIGASSTKLGECRISCFMPDTAAGGVDTCDDFGLVCVGLDSQAVGEAGVCREGD